MGRLNDILVYDHVLPDPEQYRREMLAREFRSVEVGADVFHGIAVDVPDVLPTWIMRKHPAWKATLTFCRLSPLGQVEPNMIHTDQMMGDWTGILYLNPDRPAGDGTVFWLHEAGYKCARHGESPETWRKVAFTPWHRVDAVFNRLVVFPGRYYHSRSLEENYGTDKESARLIQVMFGTA